jgi:plastocyanin
MLRRPGLCLAVALLAGPALTALAEEGATAAIVIKDHKFDPAELRLPAGKRITLTVDNQDATPEEFESKTLRVEKVIPGGTRGVVRFGPLVAGEYTFLGEFHQATAQGKVIAE